MKKGLFSLYLIALILEILPLGAVCVFADDGVDIRKTFSYFDLVPFGYANFAPFIVGLMTVALVTMSVVFLLKNNKWLKNAILIVTIIAFALSLAPLLYGIKCFSIVGGLISACFMIAFIFIALEAKKQ